MKTSAQKILALLQSSDEKNHLLALELMESLGLRQEVATLIGENTLFQHQTSEVAGLSFCYQGVSDVSRMRQLLTGLEQILMFFGASRAIKRKAYILVSDTQAVCNLAQGYEESFQLTVRQLANQIHLQFCWMVEASEAEFLANKFKEISLIIVDKMTIKKYARQYYGSRKTKVNIHMSWFDVARRCFNRKHEFTLTPCEDDISQVSFSLEYPLK